MATIIYEHDFHFFRWGLPPCQIWSF